MKLSIASVLNGYESTTVVQCGFYKYISLIEKYKLLGGG